MDHLRRALLTFDRAFQLSAADIDPADRSGRSFMLPATPLDQMGDAGFRAAHGARYAYLAGAMANGIASVDLVLALARAGIPAIFGSAGLAPARVASVIDRLEQEAHGLPHGYNLIHSPSEPLLEAELAELFIRRQVRLVEASAFMRLTLPIVRYRVHGIHKTADGRIVAPNKVIAKVSRVEVATPFLSPPPEAMLAELVKSGELTAEQAAWARQIPMAEDLTAEADSGGHTDNRPALALIPTMIELAQRLAAQHDFATPTRVGAAGGIGTPAALAAAMAMGAAYVVTGTVNQACRESGSSDIVRTMLAQAKQADVAMAPAADMFEMGVKVQVLKQGTMFPMRAAKLYDLYQRYKSLDDLPAPDRETLESQFFRKPIQQEWEETSRYFAQRDPRQITRAEADPRHKMALVFRSYLGQSSHWANAGVADRKFDFQVWCGPAMGAFNEWTKGSALEAPENRSVVAVALNLLIGAAVRMRAQILAAQGVPLARLPADWSPRSLAELERFIEHGA